MRPPENPLFSFLGERGDVRTDDRCNIIDPVASGVPWRASFPKSKQCKYWREAVNAAEELLKAAMQREGDQQDTLPQMLNDSRREAKIVELVETAAACALNFYPSADVDRIRGLTEVILFLFIHDGGWLFPLHTRDLDR